MMANGRRMHSLTICFWNPYFSTLWLNQSYFNSEVSPREMLLSLAPGGGGERTAIFYHWPKIRSHLPESDSLVYTLFPAQAKLQLMKSALPRRLQWSCLLERIRERHGIWQVARVTHKHPFLFGDIFLLFTLLLPRTSLVVAVRIRNIEGVLPC